MNVNVLHKESQIYLIYNNLTRNKFTTKIQNANQMSNTQNFKGFQFAWRLWFSIYVNFFVLLVFEVPTYIYFFPSSKRSRLSEIKEENQQYESVTLHIAFTVRVAIYHTGNTIMKNT